MAGFPDLVNVHYFDGMSGGSDGQDTVLKGGRMQSRNPIYIDPTQAPYNVKMDRYTTTAASMSSTTSPTQLTVTGYTFTNADVGKAVKVVGAAAAGANLKTTITGVTSGKAVLGSPCLTTVSNAYAVFGTDNHDALQALFNDLSFGGRGRKLARTAIFPAGACMFSGTLILPRRGTIKGAAENFVSHDIIYGARGNAAEDTGGTVFHQLWDQNCDGFHFPDPLYTGDTWWNGKLHGFAVLQDSDNTAGKGINFVNSSGTPITDASSTSGCPASSSSSSTEEIHSPPDLITSFVRSVSVTKLRSSIRPTSPVRNQPS